MGRGPRTENAAISGGQLSTRHHTSKQRPQSFQGLLSDYPLPVLSGLAEAVENAGIYEYEYQGNSEREFVEEGLVIKGGAMSSLTPQQNAELALSAINAVSRYSDLAQELGEKPFGQSFSEEEKNDLTASVFHAMRIQKTHPEVEVLDDSSFDAYGKLPDEYREELREGVIAAQRFPQRHTDWSGHNHGFIDGEKNPNAAADKLRANALREIVHLGDKTKLSDYPLPVLSGLAEAVENAGIYEYQGNSEREFVEEGLVIKSNPSSSLTPQQNAELALSAINAVSRYSDLAQELGEKPFGQSFSEEEKNNLTASVFHAMRIQKTYPEVEVLDLAAFDAYGELPDKYREEIREGVIAAQRSLQRHTDSSGHNHGFIDGEKNPNAAADKLRANALREIDNLGDKTKSSDKDFDWTDKKPGTLPNGPDSAGFKKIIEDSDSDTPGK